MDFKKLFRKDDKAVSPVIGVILMVAITVILAAAIGSSVFGQGTTESAPKANLDIKAAGVVSDTNKTGIIKFEHLGGDDINFDSTITKVMVAVGNNGAKQIDAESLGTFSVGDVQPLSFVETDGTTTVTVASGDTVNIKVIDIQTNQMICDKNVRFS